MRHLERDAGADPGGSAHAKPLAAWFMHDKQGDFRPPYRQARETVAALAETVSVSVSVAGAAARVGMSRESAYRLRARPTPRPSAPRGKPPSTNTMHRLGEAALDRCLNGVPVPIFYKGEQVGVS